MSNINGKAYAMNLVTPVYVKTSWSLTFLTPGFFALLKSLSFLFSFYHLSMISGWGYGIAFLTSGVILLIAGLAKWINMIAKPNESVLWTSSAIFFVLALVVSMNLFSAIFYLVISCVLIVAGFSIQSKGVVWLNKLIFWIAGLKAFQSAAFAGLDTLSLIHYARWVILRDTDFPYFPAEQKNKEKLKYGYMFFFSNFNGSWTQYVDSFSVAIPGGLNLLWNKNIGWLDANVETPFNGYVTRNQVDTGYYYNAYPLASSNDVKSAKKVKAELELLMQKRTASPEEFHKAFQKTTFKLQGDLSKMEHTPIVSLAHDAIERRKSIQKAKASSAKQQ